MTRMGLNYLVFDASADTDDQGCFDAMVTVTPAHLNAAQAEIAQVLDWAEANFPGQRGPVDEGGVWDFDLQSQQEWSVDEGLFYDLAQRRFSRGPGAPGAARHVLTLSLSGDAAFSAAFRDHFLADDDGPC